MITPAQMRAARALLGTDQKQLAKPTIQRMEASKGKLLRSVCFQNLVDIPQLELFFSIHHPF